MAIAVEGEVAHTLPRALGVSRAIVNCRICQRVMLVAVAAIVVIEALILVPSIEGFERDAYLHLERVGRAALEGAVTAQGIDDDIDVDKLEVLIGGRTGIVGLAIHRAGESVPVTIGETPRFSPDMFRSIGTPARLTEGQKRYEILAENTGLKGTEAVVLRLSAAHVSGDIWRFLWRVSGLVLLIAGFVGLAIVGSTWKWIVQPLIHLRDSLTCARKDPMSADKWRLAAHHQDEIGDLFHEASGLLSAISGNYRDDVGAISMLANNSSDPILVYDSSGKLTFGNKGWRILASESGTMTTQESTEPLFEHPNGSKHCVAEIVDGASFHGQVSLLLADCKVPCVLYAVRVRFGFVALLRLHQPADDRF